MKPDANPGLPRDFVIKSILRVLETAESEKQWGSVSVQFQDGICRGIREEKTTTKAENQIKTKQENGNGNSTN